MVSQQLLAERQLRRLQRKRAGGDEPERRVSDGRRPEADVHAHGRGAVARAPSTSSAGRFAVRAEGSSRLLVLQMVSGQRPDARLPGGGQAAAQHRRGRPGWWSNGPPWNDTEVDFFEGYGASSTHTTGWRTDPLYTRGSHRRTRRRSKTRLRDRPLAGVSHVHVRARPRTTPTACGSTAHCSRGRPASARRSRTCRRRPR